MATSPSGTAAGGPRKRSIVNGSVGVAVRAGIQLLAFLVTITATRALSVSDFGVYSLAASLVVLSRNLFYVGPYEFLLKTADRPTLKGSCFTANVIVALGSGAILLGLSTVAFRLFGSARFGHVLAGLVPSLLIAACSAWLEALLLRQGRVRRYFTISISAEIASSIVAIAMLALNLGLVSLVAQVYARLLAMLAMFALTVGDRPWHMTRRGEVRAVLRWSVLRYSTVLLNFSSSYGADFTLGLMLSPAATGIYRASNRVVLAVSDLFAQPLLKVTQTDLSARFAKGQPPGREWLTMFAVTAALGWGVLAGLGMASEQVVPLLLGEKWRAAAPVITVLCIVRGLSLLDVTTTAVLVCFDKQRLLIGLQAFVAVGCVTVSALLASSGTIAVAIGNGCVSAILSFGYLRKATQLAQVRLRELVTLVATALFPAALVVLAMHAATRLGSPIPHGPRWGVLATDVAVALGAFAAGLALIWLQQMSQRRRWVADPLDRQA